MTETAARVAKLILKAGVDNLAGGLSDLYKGLTEERTRRFIDCLSSESEAQRISAEAAINEVIGGPNGERILRHVCRDVLFGTEAISLAALAIVVSESRRSPFDPFWARAANTIDGLQDDDAVAFVMLLHHHADFGIHREWQTLCHFDVANLRDKPHWSNLQRLCGIGETEIYSAVSEAIRRRLVLEDTDRGRLAGYGDVAPRTFFLPPTTARYFRILGRAIEIARRDHYTILGPFDFEVIDRLCGHSNGDTQEHPE